MSLFNRSVSDSHCKLSWIDDFFSALVIMTLIYELFITGYLETTNPDTFVSVFYGVPRAPINRGTALRPQVFETSASTAPIAIGAAIIGISLLGVR